MCQNCDGGAPGNIKTVDQPPIDWQAEEAKRKQEPITKGYVEGLIDEYETRLARQHQSYLDCDCDKDYQRGRADGLELAVKAMAEAFGGGKVEADPSDNAGGW